MDELLKEILNKLHTIDSKVDSLETRFDSLETRFDSLDTKVDILDSKVDSLERGQIEIKESVQRIELSQPQDIIAILERMNKNLEIKQKS